MLQQGLKWMLNFDCYMIHNRNYVNTNLKTIKRIWLLAITIHYWTNNVQRVLGYYADKLFFDIEYRQPSDGLPDFCILKMSDSKIMFAGPPKSEIAANRNDHLVLEQITKRIGSPGAISVYLSVDNLDAYFDKVSAQGVEILEPIWNAPWGIRQFSVIDPDGNITTFTSE